MKNFVLALVALFSSVGSGNAGVGGISGGHIEFQSVSTFVHPLNSKSLCFDGESFHALVNKCMEWSADSNKSVCVRSEKVWARQPSESTRERCSGNVDSDGVCLASMKEVPYIQSPDRYFEYRDDDNRVIKRVEFRVKDCR